MEWTECISKALSYIENNITEELTIEDIAKQAMVSPFYFQKGFPMLCGFTVGEYIKKRRLTLAGSELVSTDNKIIDIALKYGYDSPDSFTKASQLRKFQKVLSQGLFRNTRGLYLPAMVQFLILCSMYTRRFFQNGYLTVRTMR